MSRISIAPSWFSFSPLLSPTRLQGRCLFRSTKECFTEVHLLKCTPLRAMQSDPSFVLICGLPKELRLEREYLFTIEQFNFRLIRPTRRNDVEPFVVATNVEAVLKNSREPEKIVSSKSLKLIFIHSLPSFTVQFVTDFLLFVRLKKTEYGLVNP